MSGKAAIIALVLWSSVRVAESRANSTPRIQEVMQCILILGPLRGRSSPSRL
jgi:hypothetical protein